MIKVEHLVKSFFLNKEEKKRLGTINSKINAINDLSFSLSAGKILMVLGTKYSGKSTLLKILGATIKPDSGSLSILEHGLDKEYKQIRKMSGYFYAGQPFFEYLNVAEHLEYFAKLKGVANSVISENIFELTDFFQINPKIKISKLSDEQRLKLGLIQSYIHKPRLLLLDEPTLGLDLYTAEPVQKLVKLAQSNGSTIIYATNNISKTELMGDEIIIMDKGKLIYQSSIEEFRKLYGSPVSGYLEIVSKSI